MLKMYFLVLFLILQNYVHSSSLENVKVDLSNSQTARLVCAISDSQFAQWFRIEKRSGLEKEILFDELRYEFPDLNSMLVKDITGADDGNVYKCKVISDDFSTDSDVTYDVKKTFKLAVKKNTEKPTNSEKPTWLDVPSKFNKVSSTQSHAVFQCRAKGNNVRVTSYRLRNNGQIEKKLRGISSVQGVVVISPKGKDTGKYKCVAQNSAGKIEHIFSIEVEQDGNWGAWEEWGKCNVECGHGKKFRQRECNNPPPSTGRRFCEGDSLEQQDCQERRCRQPVLTKFGFEVTDQYLLLHCGAKGFPSPTTQWKRNGEYLEQPNLNTTLRITRSKAKAGQYACVLKSERLGWMYTISLVIKQRQINLIF